MPRFRAVIELEVTDLVSCPSALAWGVITRQGFQVVSLEPAPLPPPDPHSPSCPPTLPTRGAQ